MDVIFSNWAWLPKKDLGEKNLRTLRARLLVEPRRTSIHQDEEDLRPIPLYREKEDYIGVPRQYFLDTRQLNHKLDMSMMSKGRPVDLEFNGKLLPDQERARDVVMSLVSTGGVGGIINAKCGFGKTVLALGTWLKFNTTCLVVVNRQFLLDQWIDRINQFVPSARIGIIRQNRCEIGDDVDIAIGMIHSLSARMDSYPDELWSWPGLVVADEVHSVAARTWMEVVPSFKSAFRVGLSGTVRRKDGLENAFFWHIGKVIYESKTYRDKPKLRRQFTGYKHYVTSRFNPNSASHATQLRLLLGNVARNKLIVSELVKASRAGRKILVLSERRRHLEVLRDLFSADKDEGVIVDFFVGGRKREELKIAEKADTIFATFQMAKEALDISTLDTAFLVSPMSDVEQACGRIMRYHKDKKPALIVDFIDEKAPSFVRMWNKRRKFYVAEGIFKDKER
jgi:superfamily II DNA or RNA helicase